MRLFVLCALVLLDGGCHPKLAHVARTSPAVPFYMLPVDALEYEPFCIGPPPGGGPTMRCVTVAKLRWLVWSERAAE